MENDKKPADPDNEPWWARWVAGPLDAVLSTGLFCIALGVVLMALSPSSAQANLFIVGSAWVSLVSAYYLLRWAYGWYDDVPLVFGRDPPYQVSASRFLTVFLAHILSAGRQQLTAEEASGRARALLAIVEDGTKLFRFNGDMLVEESDDMDASLDLNLHSLVRCNTLARDGETYTVTDVGAERIRTYVQEAFEQDELVMDELAWALHTNKETLCGIKPRVA